MDAELVAVGQDDPRDLALLHVQGRRAELEESSAGGRKVVTRRGSDIDTRTVDTEFSAVHGKQAVHR
jgi:hypothetical protein